MEWRPPGLDGDKTYFPGQGPIMKNRHSLVRLLVRRLMRVGPLLVVMLIAVGVIYLFVEHLSSKSEVEATQRSEEALKTEDPQPARESAYLEALELAKAPESEAAAAEIMARLAPVTGAVSSGHGKAHLWMAKKIFRSATDPPIKSDQGEGDAPAVPSPDKLEEGKEHLRRAVALAPEILEAHEMLVAAHLRDGERKEAVSVLNEAIPRFPGLALSLAPLLRESGKLIDAEAQAQSAASHFEALALGEESGGKPLAALGSG